VLANGSFPNSSLDLFTQGIMVNGSLQGSGTIGGNVVTNIVMPSADGTFSGAPGVLNVAGLSIVPGMMGSSVQVRLNGAAPGAGYDRINVSGGVSIAPNTFLGITMSPSFVPTKGESYIFIDNASSDPIVGTFNGYPEGAIVTLQAVYPFKVSYMGGDGNDFVLISQNGRNPTNTVLVSSPNPSLPGDPVTFTATVHGNAPTGEVLFKQAGVVIGAQMLAAGSASFTTSALAAGSHEITAEYRGDPNNAGSTSPVLVQTVAVQGGTSPGTDVAVEVETTLPGGSTAVVDIHFETVTGGGVTTVTATTSGPTPPDGFQLGNPPVYFDVHTDAAFSGNVTLCFGWSQGQFALESSIGLWHFEGGLWVDVTTLRDTANNFVCGRTTSFSPFALMEQRFAFTGFHAPVANLPAVNRVKAGAAVPIKFSLGGDRGLAVISAGYPRSGAVPCDGSETSEILEGTSTAGGSGLSYAPDSGQYMYVWKTDATWAGTCRQLEIRFVDGTVARAGFSFR
ncbi:MAG TPA: PxKF domain-containing protein, partial [Usitatibacter sp.]|nr:PxKF domain-containing protein [Usitatibacter sp.]